MKHERLIEILRARFDYASAIGVADWARAESGFRVGEDYAPDEISGSRAGWRRTATASARWWPRCAPR